MLTDPMQNGHDRQSLLTPDNCVLILIDHLRKTAFIQNENNPTLTNNIVGLAKAAKLFDIPVIITDVHKQIHKDDSAEIHRHLQNATEIDRSCINCWDDGNIIRAIETSGRRKLLMAGHLMEVSLVFPALCALEDGYEVYVVEDASAGMTVHSHEVAMERMIQAGVVPVTWAQVMCELQEGNSLPDTAVAVETIFRDHGYVSTH